MERKRTDEGFFGGSLNPKQALISKFRAFPRFFPSRYAEACFIFER